MICRNGGLTPTARSATKTSSAAPWRGWTAKLDALAELGVTTLYLCPIFESASNHRYNTADYGKIDPMLGTKEDFRALCSQAKARGSPGHPGRRVQPHRLPEPLFQRRRLLSHPGGGPKQGEPLLRLVLLPSTALRLRFLVGASAPCPPCGRTLSQLCGLSWTGRTRSCGAGCGWAPPAGGWMWQTSCRLVHRESPHGPGGDNTEAMLIGEVWEDGGTIRSPLPAPPLPVGQRAARIDELSLTARPSWPI